jgi:hypothetical protein
VLTLTLVTVSRCGMKTMVSGGGTLEPTEVEFSCGGVEIRVEITVELSGGGTLVVVKLIVLDD